MRATQLCFRSPKEANCPFYQSIDLNPDKITYPKNFQKLSRFTHGSIYDFPFHATEKRVGPGCYKTPENTKPCNALMVLSNMERQTGFDESKFECVNGLMVLQAGNLTRSQQQTLKPFTDRNAVRPNYNRQVQRTGMPDSTPNDQISYASSMQRKSYLNNMANQEARLRSETKSGGGRLKNPSSQNTNNINFNKTGSNFKSSVNNDEVESGSPVLRDHKSTLLNQTMPVTVNATLEKSDGNDLTSNNDQTPMVKTIGSGHKNQSSMNGTGTASRNNTTARTMGAMQMSSPRGQKGQMESELDTRGSKTSQRSQVKVSGSFVPASMIKERIREPFLESRHASSNGRIQNQEPIGSPMSVDKFINNRVGTGNGKRRGNRRQILVGSDQQAYLPSSNVSTSLKANITDVYAVPSHLLHLQKKLMQTKEDRLLENYFGARISGSRSLTQSGFSRIRKQIVNKTQNL